MKRSYTFAAYPGYSLLVRSPLSADEKALAHLPIKSSTEAAVLIGERIADELVEVMVVVGLTARSRVVFMTEVARGGVSKLYVELPSIFRMAIVTGAKVIVIGHNHPSGDTLPSPEDLELTRRIVDAGNMMGIMLMDHVIVAPDKGYTSLLDLGVISEAS